MIKRLFWTLALLFAATLAFALPSVEQVQAEVKAGRYAQAESMMQEVVAAKPRSAKAHYVYAEILAHNGRFDEAARQARQAREIDPAIGFTDPAKFRGFEELLQREQAQQQSRATPASPSTLSTAAPAVPARAAAARDTGLPGWVWLVGIVLAVWLLWRLLARRRTPTYAGPGTTGAYGPNGMQVQQPGSGSGLMGAGLAAAGGFAAGMLAEKMLEGDRHVPHDEGRQVASAGGLQPGMFDDYNSAAADLQQRDVDFGSGGDWGGDGGGMDVGDGGDW
jgi:tetratricopeptide (TPR) repeat protein